MAAVKRKTIEYQLNIIREAISQAVVFLCSVCPTPGSSSHGRHSGKPTTSNHLTLKSCYACEPSDLCYVMIALHYVSKSDIKVTCEPQLVDDEKALDEDNSLKASILRWFHYKCKEFLIISRNAGVETPESIELSKRADSFRVTAKIRLAVRNAAKAPYSAYDELIDRLAFLSQELEVDDPKKLPIISSATKRIKDRRFTRHINPGHLSSNEDGFTDAPWELHALCHHSRLLLWEQLQRSEVEGYRQRFCKFMSSEACLVPSWERTNLNARRGFLRSEATCVLASTLVDICQKELQEVPSDSNAVVLHSQQITGNPISGDTATPEQLHHGPGGHRRSKLTRRATSVASKPNITPRSKEKSKKRKMRPKTTQDPEDGRKQEPTSTAAFDPEVTANLDIFANSLSAQILMQKQLELLEQSTTAEKLPKPIEWAAYHPSTTYHPDSFFNSMDDSPHLYTRSVTRKIYIPSDLKRYFAQGDEKLFYPSWKRIRSDNLSQVSIVDIITPDNWGIHDCKEDQADLRTRGRLSSHHLTEGIGKALVNAMDQACKNNPCGVLHDDPALAVYGAFVDGKLSAER
jgi:hypothetical protein